jgi:uncharacterized protein YndB with AHSA1/START domain
MRPLTCAITIEAPRERVFDHLSDIANHGAFSDHYLKDFRLDRLESSGLGAAARFRIAFGRSLWGTVAITVLERPHRIVLEGDAGRLGHVGVRATYTLTDYGQDMTRLEYELETAAASRMDDLRAALGGRSWLKLQTRRALRRLAGSLEQAEQPSVQPARMAAG